MSKKARYHLHCRHTGDVIYEGWFETAKGCVEAAVHDHVNLDGVDCSGMNLTCANLDDAQMVGAKFDNANLSGANLSEGVFDNATFIGADLTHACLALSSFMNVDMMQASFGSTDVTDAVISGCQFSCPSVFTILLHRAALFNNCSFIHEDKGICRMSRPPVVIQGLPRDIVYMDQVIKIGTDYVYKGDLIAAGHQHLDFIYGEQIATFLRPTLYDTTIDL